MAGFRSSQRQIILLLIFIGSVPVLSAPYLPESAREDSQKQIPLDHFFRPSQGLIGPLFRQNDISLHPPSQGVCHYQLRYYEEGERIDTQEPCLNCTCHNSMLMCYLKVCPFSKPIGKDCTVEKSPDQCCPVITCPQVPVNLQVMHMVPWTTTSPTSSTTAVAHHTEHGCSIEGQYYPDGAQVPGDPLKPCELCYCIRNHTACIMQECILKVDGCDPVFEDGICCPIRYMCAHDKEQELITTTTLSPNGTLITTTMQPPSIGGCMHDNEFYADGASIDSSDPCEHCYCMNSDVVCAIQECRSPLDEEDENCIPRAPPPGQCCPEAYDCPDVPELTTPLHEITERPSEIDTIPKETIDKEEEIHEPSTPKMDEAATPSVSQVTEESILEITEPSKDLESPAVLVDDVDKISTIPATEDFTSTSTLKTTDDSIITEISQPEMEISTEQDLPTLTEAPVEIVDIETEKPVIVEKSTAEPSVIELDETFGIQPEMPDVSDIHVDPDHVDTEEGTSKPSIFSEVTTALPEEKTSKKPDEPKEMTEDIITSVPEKEDVTEEPDKIYVPTTIPSKEVSPQEETLIEYVEVDPKHPEDKETATSDYKEIKTTALPVDIIETESELPEEPLITTVKPDEPVKEIITQKPIDDYDDISTPSLATGKPIGFPDMTPQPELTEDDVSVTTVKHEKEIDTISTIHPKMPGEKPTDAPSETRETTQVPEPIPSFPSHELALIPEDDEVDPEVITDKITTTPKVITTTKSDHDEILLTSSSSPVDGECHSNGTTYQDGEIVPIYNQCQEECHCRNSIVTCQFKACPSPPPVFLRCDIRTEEDCCPQYECPVFEAAEEPSPNCVRDGIQFLEGDYVPSKDLCTDCYCLYGEIVCAFQECPAYGDGCKPLETPKGSCCPTKYECPELEVGDMTMDKEDKTTDPSKDIATTSQISVEDLEVTTKPISEGDGDITSPALPTEDHEIEQTTFEPKDKEQTTVESLVTESHKPEKEISVTDIVTEILPEAITTSAEYHEVSSPHPELVTDKTVKEKETITTSLPIDSKETTVVDEALVTHPEEVTDEFKVEVTTPLKEETEKLPEVTTVVPEMITDKIPTDTEELTSPESVTEYEAEKPEETTSSITELVTEEVEIVKETTDVISEVMTVQPEMTLKPEVVDQSEITQPDYTTDEIVIIEATTSQPESVTEHSSPEVATPTEPQIAVEEEEETEILTEQPEIDTEKTYIETEISTPTPDDVTEIEKTTIQPTIEVEELVSTIKPEMEIATEKIEEDKPTTIEVDLATEYAELETESPDTKITVQPELVPEVTDPSVEISTSKLVPEEITVIPDTSSIQPEIATDAKIIEDSTLIQPEQITEESITQKPITEDEVETDSYLVEEPATTRSPDIVTEEIINVLPDKEEGTTTPKYVEDITTKKTEEYDVTDIQEVKTTEMPESFETTSTKLEIIDETVSVTDKPIVLTKEPLSTSYLPPDSTTEGAISDTSAEPESGIPGEGHCLLNSIEYKNGENVPTSSQCQEACTCKDSVVTCQLKACPAPPPIFLRCEVTQQTDECCPSYECPVVEPSAEPSPKCKREEVQYLEGDYVPSKDICSDCYCLYGEIVCATLECPPMPKGCIRSETSEGNCCPTKYECPEQDLDEDITTPSPTEVITEKQLSTDFDVQTENITTEMSALQTEHFTEDFTEKSTTKDDSSQFVTKEPKPEEQTEKLEDITLKEPTDLYTVKPELITTGITTSKIPEETDLTKVPFVELTTAKEAEISMEQESSTAYTTESLLEIQPEKQSTPSTDIHTFMPIDVEIQTESVTKSSTEGEIISVTSSVVEKEYTEAFTESSVESETGKYTSKPDDTTIDYEATSAIITDKLPIEVTTLGTIDTEKEKHTEFPTIMTIDTDMTTELIEERPIDKPENETMIESSPTTELTEIEEEKPKEDALKTCLWSNNTYEHGVSVPPDSECQDFCKCDNGTVKCKHRACPPVPPSFLRCASSSSNDTCCPSYDCGEPEPSDHFCLHEGMIFNNGDYVPSASECLDCYCLEGEVVCASLECGVPRTDCKALVQRNTDCCPILYECSESPIESGEFMISPDLGIEIAAETSTPSVLTTKLVFQEIPEDDAVEHEATLTTEHSVDISSIKPISTEKPAVTESIYPISDSTEQLLTAAPEDFVASKETTVKSLEEIVTSKPEEIVTTKPEEIVTIKPDETYEEEIITSEPEEIITTKPEWITTKPEEISEEIITSKPEEIITTKPEMITTKPEEIPEDIITAKPEEITTIEPAEIITTKPEELTEEIITGRPEEITTIEPEEIITTKPEELPEEIITGKPEEITTIKPEEIITTKPEEIPEEIITSIPEKIITSEPEEIITIKPEEMITSKPEEIITTVPEETITTETGDIPTDKPEEIVTSKPDEIYEEIVTSKPEEIITTEPDEILATILEEISEELVTSKPEEIITTKPKEIFTIKPEKIPEEITTDKPKEKVPSYPDQIITTKPGEIVTSTTEEISHEMLTSQPEEIPEEIVTSEPEGIITDKPEEIYTSKPEEIPDEIITSKPEILTVIYEDVTEMDDTFTKPESISVSEISSPSSISTDAPFVAETEFPVSSITHKPLPERPEDDEVFTLVTSVKPEEIMISHEIEKEINITSTTTKQPTKLPVSEDISVDALSLQTEKPLVTMPSTTTLSEEFVKEPSLPEDAIPEEPKIEEPEDHKFEEEIEPEPPFPPFPGFIPEETFDEISEDDIKDKETVPEMPFSPFPFLPEDISEAPEELDAEKPIDEMPEKEMKPELLLPPEISEMTGETYLPPHIFNETTTWKPSTTTELVLGPGHCLFDRKVYSSAEQIPRDDPCDFCFCFRSDIICLQQTCPDPISGCYEEAIPGFCCPRYECPVRQEIVNITTTTPSPIPGFPPIKKTSRVAMCEIEGKHYASGEVVKSASSPCHECICGSDGFMKCIPKECDTNRKIYKHGYR